jgi:SPP1 gp7 family putative phage head morphogenesis protein
MSEMDLIDLIIAQALQLQRLSANDEAEAERIMADLERELRQLAASHNIPEAKKREIDGLIAEATKAIDARYTAAGQVVDTHGLTVLVADQTVATLQQAFGDAQAPSAERLASLAKEVLIDGAPTSAWWDKQAEDTAFKFAGAVRQGVVNGETQERIVARIAGPNGFMDMSRRNARTLVHSSVMTAANNARMAAYRKNFKHARGIRWVATLDSHTCLRCAALDGMAWDFDANGLDDNTLEWPGPPPLHWSCRCVASPVPKSLNDLMGMTGLDEQLAATATRASPYGVQKGDLTMAGFLNRNPTVAEEILGKKRVAMFQAGRLTLRDLVSGTGRPLTLDELAAR